MTDEFRSVVDRKKAILKRIHEDLNELMAFTPKEVFQKYSAQEKRCADMLWGAGKLLRHSITGMEKLINEVVSVTITDDIIKKMQ